MFFLTRQTIFKTWMKMKLNVIYDGEWAHQSKDEPARKSDKIQKYGKIKTC